MEQERGPATSSTDSTIGSVGVMPPAESAEQTSRRSAPARSAVTAACRSSTASSTVIIARTSRVFGSELLGDVYASDAARTAYHGHAGGCEGVLDIDPDAAHQL